MSLVLSPPYSQSDDIHYGEAKGRTKIVWFVDFTCTRTRKVRDMLLRSKDLFGPARLSLSVRMAPPDNPSEEADIACRAAIAANWQGRYAEMHLKLFEHDAQFTEAKVLKFAEDLDFDVEQFKEDLTSSRTEKKLAEDHASFLASVDVPMPAIFIDGQPFDGAWDESSLIEAIEKPLGVRLQRASQEFVHWAASAGLILVLATIAALCVANFGGLSWYEHLRHLPIALGAGESLFSLPLEVWINDGLMSLFFLLVGIEIKRELIDGELSSFEKASLPIVAALGGMALPAIIFVTLNVGQPTIHGWGVPMATDIAFTLGLMALLGSRVPSSLKIFVSALAIADDLGAIVVIALFYGHGFNFEALVSALIVFSAMLVINYARIYDRAPYMVLFVLLWFFVYESGLHATLAGVLTAAAIPSRPSANILAVSLHANAVVDEELKLQDRKIGDRAFSRLAASLDRLREPGFHLQNALENWANYLILPLFAFFNTGILIFGSQFSILAPESAGVVFGLVIGKPLGIVGSVFVATRLGIARLSSEISWMQLIGASFLAGIGFTMSIFIASAAFEGDQLGAVKLAVLFGSSIAAIIGMAILYISSSTPQPVVKIQRP